MSAENYQLLYAAKTGNLAEIKRILALGADVNIKDAQGWTPLHHACYEGREEVTALLVEKGAKVDAKTNEKQTPLMNAAYNGSVRIVEILLEHGAKVNAKDQYGWTPLMFVTIYRHVKTRMVDLAKRLLDKGADAAESNKDGWNAAMMARKHGMTELEQLILKHMEPKGASKNPLHEYVGSAGSAAVKGAAGKIDAILKNGADINELDADTRATALDVAARNNNPSMIRLLIKRGADPDIPNGIRRTPLLNAAVWGKTEALKELIAAGADANAADLAGGTALDAARDDNNLGNVELLIRAGADVNAQDRDGNTPLMKAALNHQDDIIRLLLDNGADPDLRNKYGQTYRDL